jgi:hypothetical protein
MDKLPSFNHFKIGFDGNTNLEQITFSLKIHFESAQTFNLTN